MEMRHAAPKRLRPKVEIARASRRAYLCFGGKPRAERYLFWPCRGVEDKRWRKVVLKS